MISKELILKLFPKHKKAESLVFVLNDILPKYNITTKEQIACFLSQCGHESAGFSKLSENLNYSAAGLCATWKKRFPTLDSARAYHRNPEKIANKVYCDRLGNGNEASGDGWKYRGRGVIQLTGKANYEKLSKGIGKSLSECIDYCATLEGGVESACWFWKTNNLNRYVEKNDFEGLTEAINGGLNGYVERQELYEIVIKLL
jgi:putative chitinase